MIEKHIAILGAGNIGKFIAETLGNDHTNGVLVALYDYDQKAIDSVDAPIAAVRADLSKKDEIIKAVSKADIVINALPSFLGFQALQTSIEQGKHVVDFSYMTEDPRQLDALAKEKGVTAVTDFGFAPGMCHMFVGRALKLLGKGLDSTIYVGGLPQEEKDEYKVVFSARDVLEEYSRPARIISNGRVQTRIPFVDNLTFNKELPNGRTLDVSGFISDGLRTMINLDGIDSLVESTLRYHNHFKKMVGLKEDGFFKPENIEKTAEVLAKKWERTPEDRDMSILNVISKNDSGVLDHFLYDEFDDTTGIHSMARTTGFPVIFMALMIANKEFDRPGVNIPEVLGQDDNVFTAITTRLKDQGITLTEKLIKTSGVRT